MIQKKGFMDSYKTKTFRRIFEEFRNTILLKYADGLDKVVCSIGSHNDMLAQQINFKELHLVDLKFGECKYKYNKYIHYYEMDLNEFITHAIGLGFKFDVIIMSSIIEHLTHVEKVNCLKRIKKLLNPNGVFILGYPNAHSINRLLGVEMGLLSYAAEIKARDKEVGHKHMYSWRSLYAFRGYIGLKEIETKGIMFKPLPNSMMDKYFSDKLDTFIELGKELGIQACAYIVVVYKNEIP